MTNAPMTMPEQAAPAADDVAAARTRVAELEAEWNELAQRIADSTATPEDYERRAGLLSSMQGAREALQATQDRATRAAQAAVEQDYLRRVDEVMLQVSEFVPRLVFALQDLKQLASEAHTVPFSRSAPHTIDEILGVPADFAERLLTAIREAAPDAEWNFDAAFPGRTATRPTRRSARMWWLRDPRAMAVPYGTTGFVNLATGKISLDAPEEER